MTAIELKESVYSHSPDARRARHNLITIRSEIARHEAALGFDLTSAQGSAPDTPSVGHVRHSEAFTVLARYQLAESLILASPIVPEIEALDALHAEIAAAEAREAEAAAAAQAARNALEEARAAALAKAEAAADKDPKVIAARKALEAIAPAPVEPAAPVAKEAAPVAKEAPAELPSDLLDLETDHEALAGDFK